MKFRFWCFLLQWSFSNVLSCLSTGIDFGQDLIFWNFFAFNFLNYFSNRLNSRISNNTFWQIDFLPDQHLEDILFRKPSMQLAITASRDFLWENASLSKTRLHTLYRQFIKRVMGLWLIIWNTAWYSTKSITPGDIKKVR